MEEYMIKCKIIKNEECKYARLFKQGIECEIQANKFGPPTLIEEMIKKHIPCALKEWEKLKKKK
jgi:hypothetical protein